jgi:hypothetical protein
LWTTFAEGPSSTWTTFDLQTSALKSRLHVTDLGLKEESTSFFRRQHHIAGFTLTRDSSTGGGAARRATLFQSSSPASELRLSLPVLSDLKSILKVCLCIELVSSSERQGEVHAAVRFQDTRADAGGRPGRRISRCCHWSLE